MTDDAPRRFKLESELDDSERAAVARPGHSGRVETDRYLAWRRAVLDEGDEAGDLTLRERLLREEAEHRRELAADRERRTIEGLGVEEWLEREQATNRGEDVPDLTDAAARDRRREADELEAEAAALAAYLADTDNEGGPSVEDELVRIKEDS